MRNRAARGGISVDVDQPCETISLLHGTTAPAQGEMQSGDRQVQPGLARCRGKGREDEIERRRGPAPVGMAVHDPKQLIEVARDERRLGIPIRTVKYSAGRAAVAG